jgi:hypothetical protein
LETEVATGVDGVDEGGGEWTGGKFDFDCVVYVLDWSEFVAEEGKNVACASYDITNFDVSWRGCSVL